MIERLGPAPLSQVSGEPERASTKVHCDRWPQVPAHGVVPRTIRRSRVHSRFEWTPTRSAFRAGVAAAGHLAPVADRRGASAAAACEAGLVRRQRGRRGFRSGSAPTALSWDGRAEVWQSARAERRVRAAHRGGEASRHLSVEGGGTQWTGRLSGRHAAAGRGPGVPSGDGADAALRLVIASKAAVSPANDTERFRRRRGS